MRPLPLTLALLLLSSALLHAQDLHPPAAKSPSPSEALPIPTAPTTSTFRSPNLGLSYIYSDEYKRVGGDDNGTFSSSQAPPPAGQEKACVRSPLATGRGDKAGDSIFVLSVIDDTCPSVFHDAQQLEEFTRTQILRQLQRTGVPSLTHLPVAYTLDGYPAAVVTALARAEAVQTGDSYSTTYGAKVCVLTDRPLASLPPARQNELRRKPVPVKQIVCWDFTSPEQERLPGMLAFKVVFGHTDGLPGEPQPLVPAELLK